MERPQFVHPSQWQREIDQLRAEKLELQNQLMTWRSLFSLDASRRGRDLARADASLEEEATAVKRQQEALVAGLEQTIIKLRSELLAVQNALGPENERLRGELRKAQQTPPDSQAWRQPYGKDGHAAELDVARRREQELHTELKQVTARAETAERLRSELEARLSSSSAELLAVRQELERAQSEWARTRDAQTHRGAELVTLKSKDYQRSTGLDELQKRELAAATRRLDEQAASFKREAASLVQAAEHRAERDAARMQSLQQELRTAREEAVTLRAQKASLEADLARGAEAAESVRRRLDAELQAQCAETATVRAALTRAEDVTRRQDDELRQMRREAADTPGRTRDPDRVDDDRQVHMEVLAGERAKVERAMAAEQQAREELDRVRAELDRERAATAESGTRLLREVEEGRQALLRAREELVRVRAELDRERAATAESGARLLREVEDSRQALVSERTAHLEVLAGERAKVERAMAAEQQAREELDRVRAELDRERAATAESGPRLLREVEESRQALVSERRAHLEALAAERAQVERAEQQARVELDRVRAGHDRLRTELDRVRAERASNGDSGARLLREVEESRQALQLAREELDRVRAERAAAGESGARLLREVEDSRQALVSERTAHLEVLAGERAKVERAMAAEQQAREELDRVRAELDRMRADRASTGDSGARLLREVEDSRQALQRAREELDRVRAELDRVRAERASAAESGPRLLREVEDSRQALVSERRTHLEVLAAERAKVERAMAAEQEARKELDECRQALASDRRARDVVGEKDGRLMQAQETAERLKLELASKQEQFRLDIAQLSDAGDRLAQKSRDQIRSLELQASAARANVQHLEEQLRSLGEKCATEARSGVDEVRLLREQHDQVLQELRASRQECLRLKGHAGSAADGMVTQPEGAEVRFQAQVGQAELQQKLETCQREQAAEQRRAQEAAELSERKVREVEAELRELHAQLTATRLEHGTNQRVFQHAEAECARLRTASEQAATLHREQLSKLQQEVERVRRECDSLLRKAREEGDTKVQALEARLRAQARQETDELLRRTEERRAADIARLGAQLADKERLLSEQGTRFKQDMEQLLRSGERRVWEDEKRMQVLKLQLADKEELVRLLALARQNQSATEQATLVLQRDLQASQADCARLKHHAQLNQERADRLHAELERLPRKDQDWLALKAQPDSWATAVALPILDAPYELPAGALVVARVLRNFEGAPEREELTLRAGDWVSIHELASSGWAKGRRAPGVKQEALGTFPSLCTDVLGRISMALRAAQAELRDARSQLADMPARKDKGQDVEGALREQSGQFAQEMTALVRACDRRVHEADERSARAEQQEREASREREALQRQVLSLRAELVSSRANWDEATGRHEHQLDEARWREQGLLARLEQREQAQPNGGAQPPALVDGVAHAEVARMRSEHLAELAGLRAQLVEMARSKVDSEEQVARERAERARLEAELASARLLVAVDPSRIEGAAASDASFLDEYGTLRAQLDAARAEAASAKCELAAETGYRREMRETADGAAPLTVRLLEEQLLAAKAEATDVKRQLGALLLRQKLSDGAALPAAPASCARCAEFEETLGNQERELVETQRQLQERSFHSLTTGARGIKAQETIETLQAECTKLKRLCATLQSQADDFDGVKGALEEALSHAQAMLREMEARSAKATQQHMQALRDLEGARNDLRVAQQELQDCRRDVSQLREQNSALSAQQTRVAQEAQPNSRQGAQLAEALRDLEGARNDLRVAQQELQDCGRDASQLREQNSALSAQQTRVAQELDGWRRMAQEGQSGSRQGALLAEALRDLEGARSGLRVAQQELQDCRRDVSQLREQNSALSAQQTRVAQEAQPNSRQGAQLAEALRDLEGARNDLRVAQQELQDCRRDASQLREQHAQVAHELDGWRRAVEQKTQAATEAHGELVSRLYSRAQSAEAGLREMEEANVQLRGQLGQQAAALAELHSQLRSQAERAEELQHRNEDLLSQAELEQSLAARALNESSLEAADITTLLGRERVTEAQLRALISQLQRRLLTAEAELFLALK